MAKKNTKSNLPKYNKRLPKYAYGSYLNRPNYVPQYNMGTNSNGTQAGIGAVSAVNPIIGGVAGLGESMVSPLEQNFKSVNQGSGKFDNRNQAVGADVARSMLDPFTAMSRTLQDDGASAGEKIASVGGNIIFGPGGGSILGAAFAGKRADRLEEGNMREAQSVKNQERNRVQAGEFYQNQQAQGQAQHGTQRFQNGGNLPQQEGNGSFTSYEGQGHEGPDGGIPVDQMGNPAVISGQEPVGLTENKESTFDGYVFSEELKPDNKRSFSDLAKALNKKYYG